MPLTGRFGFRRSLMGKMILQVEEETPVPWPFTRQGRVRQRWRDARHMDIVRPEVRGLIDLRDYVQHSPEANFAAPLFGYARRRHASDRLPQAEASPLPNVERNEAGMLNGAAL